MLANLYMNRFLKHWRGSGRGEAYRARVISYADDFVILSRGYATEALAWTKAVLNRLGLALNEAKTSIRDARHEQDRRDPGSRKSGAVAESERLNSLLRGWTSYFSYGTRLMAYRAADNYVCDRVRGLLVRRHKVPTRGAKRFSDDVVFGELGVLRLRRVHIGALPSVSG